MIPRRDTIGGELGSDRLSWYCSSERLSMRAPFKSMLPFSRGVLIAICGDAATAASRVCTVGATVPEAPGSAGVAVPRQPAPKHWLGFRPHPAVARARKGLMAPVFHKDSFETPAKPPIWNMWQCRCAV